MSEIFKCKISLYKWCLSDFYIDDFFLKLDLEKLMNLLDKFNKYKFYYHINHKELKNILETRNQIYETYEKLYIYTKLKHHQDITKNNYLEINEFICNIKFEIYDIELYLKNKIKYIDKSYIELLNEEDYQNYIKWISKYKNIKYNVLSQDDFKKFKNLLDKEKTIVLNYKESSKLSSNIFELNKNKIIEISPNKSFEMSINGSRCLRKKIYETYSKKYTDKIYAITENLNDFITLNKYKMLLNDHKSILNYFLNLDKPTLFACNQLYDGILCNLNMLHNYISLRKVNGTYKYLYEFDLPWKCKTRKKIKYNMSLNIIKRSINILGDEYNDIVDKAIHSNWIDVFERKNKLYANYTISCYGVHPYVLINYSNNIYGLLTVSHEIGHAVQEYLSCNNQPFFYSKCQSIISEITSSLNEILVLEYLLRCSKGSEEQIDLLIIYMEIFRTKFFRQCMIFEFEKIIYKKIELNELIIVKDLKQIYVELIKKYYGNSFEIDEITSMEWARIPNLFDFSSLKYLFGFTIATIIMKNILINKEFSKHKYMEFLKSGSSADVSNLLEKLDINIEKNCLVNTPLVLFNRIYNKLSILLKN